MSLVAGIDHYAHGSSLAGCVRDARAVAALLARHADRQTNFGVELLAGDHPDRPVTRSMVRDGVERLFAADHDVALFYFAGHGQVDAVGGYLLAADSRRGDEGVALADIVAHANRSPARHRIIVLDSCRSGVAGGRPLAARTAELTEGTTILTACTDDGYAAEDGEGGVFTRLLVHALGGAAANLVGDVTPGSVYAHIDQSLGPWQQRPVFKTNVKTFVSLRRVEPPIALVDLHRIVELFPCPDHELRLDPTFEPEVRGRAPGMPGPVPANTEIFAVLQRYSRVNLVVPVGAPHMWHAAMERKACRLTVLGQHYRRLVERGCI